MRVMKPADFHDNNFSVSVSYLYKIATWSSMLLGVIFLKVDWDGDDSKQHPQGMC